MTTEDFGGNSDHRELNLRNLGHNALVRKTAAVLSIDVFIFILEARVPLVTKSMGLSTVTPYL